LIKNRCSISVSGKIDRDRRKQPGNLGWNRENPFKPVSIGFLRRSGAGKMAWTAAAGGNCGRAHTGQGNLLNFAS